MAESIHPLLGVAESFTKEILMSAVDKVIWEGEELVGTRMIKLTSIRSLRGSRYRKLGEIKK